MVEIASEYKVHSTQINSWKKQDLVQMKEAFNGTSQESIRQLLGHESLESTAVYTAVSIVELQERFNKLGAGRTQTRPF